MSAANPFAALAGGYQVIMADPPWSYAAFSEKGHAKGAKAQYACMSIEDIAALPVSDLAAPDAWLMLWTTNPCLRQAFTVMDAWGFTYSTKLTWVKTSNDGGISFGTGHVVRSCDEPILIGRRGNPRIYSKSTASVFMAPRRQHSRKPEKAYDLARVMFGDHVRRLDLFSRQSRPGWDVWGDESTKFDEVAA